MALDFTPYRQLNGDEIRAFGILAGNFAHSIETNIRTVKLGPNPSCEVLSCVWYPKEGTVADDAEPEPIIVRGHHDFQLHTTSNLSWAMNNLRQTSGPRTMWIDAICIDQLNLRERNHQAALMSNIYTQASLAIIWLRPSREDIDSLLRSFV